MSLYVKKVEGKGRGVFSDSPIKKGEMIENSPVIKIPENQIELVEKTDISQYWINWSGKSGVIGLGLVSMYNHSSTPNAEYLLFVPEDSIIMNAIKDISPHEEICTNYKNKEKFDFSNFIL